MSNSVFEDPKQGEQKSSESISGADSVSLQEPQQSGDLNLSQTEDKATEERKNIAMEVSSLETAGEITSSALLSSQSEQSTAAVPMEVDLSAPSSGFTSAEQTPDSSQAPLVLGASDSEGVETNQSIENSEEEKSVYSDQVFKEKEDMAISEDIKPELKTVPEEKGVTGESCKKEEETAMEVDKLAAQETVLYIEKPPKEETEKFNKTPELGKSSTEGKLQEETKSSTDVEDTEMTTEKKKSEDEKSERDVKPEKMETDEASADATGNVEMDEAAKVVSPTSSSEPVTSTADTAAVSVQGGSAEKSAEKSKRAPLTAEQEAKKTELMDRCNHALQYCLRRFPQHHKSRYRLAYVYYYSPKHKVTQSCVSRLTSLAS